MAILRILFYIILAIVALKLFFFLLGVFGLLAWALAAFLLVGLFVYGCLFIMGGSKKTAAQPDEKTGPQLWNHTGNVILFSERPDLLQITGADDTTAGTIKLPNGQDIKVMEEGDNVLKVKVLSGASKGNVAWVSKSDVTGYKK